MESLSKLKIRKEKMRRLGAPTSPFYVRINAFRFTLFLFAIISLATVSINFIAPRFIEPVRTVVLDVFSPLLSVNKVLREQHQHEGSPHKNDDKLEQTNAYWEMFSAKLQDENTLLKKALKFRPDPEILVATGYVINTILKPLTQQIIVDAGHRSGVEEGNSVVTKDGLVGQVKHSAAFSSQILPITSKNAKVPVRVAGTEIRGIIEGRGRSSLRLRYVKNINNLKIGQRLVTTSDNGLSPNITVGHIQKIKNNQVKVRPAVKFSSLLMVYILQSQTERTHAETE